MDPRPAPRQVKLQKAGTAETETRPAMTGRGNQQQVGVRPDCQSGSKGHMDAEAHGQMLGSAVCVLATSPPNPQFLGFCSSGLCCFSGGLVLAALGAAASLHPTYLLVSAAERAPGPPTL